MNKLEYDLVEKNLAAFAKKIKTQIEETMREKGEEYGLDISWENFKEGNFIFEAEAARDLYKNQQSNYEQLKYIQSEFHKDSEKNPKTKEESIDYSSVLSSMLSFFIYSFLKKINSSAIVIQKDGKPLPQEEVNKFIPLIVLKACRKIIPSSLEDIKVTEDYLNEYLSQENQDFSIGLIVENFCEILRKRGLSDEDLRKAIELP